MPLKIAVLCGGTSEEREVSLASAAMIVPALRQSGHTVEVLDIHYDLLPQTSDGVQHLPINAGSTIDNGGRMPAAIVPKQLNELGHVRAFDLVFLALHGGTGEDGTVQAALDLMNIPYTGSGHLASAVCMDKDISKRLLRAAGIVTPDWTLLEPDASVRPDDFHYPVVVKPNRLGSTVGLSVVREAAALKTAVEFAFRFDTEVLVEQFIAGRELTVGVLADRSLAVGEILIDAESAFNYDDKYTPGAVKEIFPADLPFALEQSVKQVALAAHRLLKLRDYSRADFRLDKDGKLWLLELNSLPGMTATSLLPQSARAMGIEFAQLCDLICQLAVTRHSRVRPEHR
ncbi:D-alanine--D-alanine ligase family protein [Burkholderia ambifaria]|jgi:D-alanine-D-alanine ligase|uniref:D-alanine--D-alanine ligase family protein n=1 Tax=Burkholderia ambifaria TaxID=152480 RepID=UPI00158B912B|nr:D-alanine--D-alanine ligase [Burkholderia ambifaria]